MSRNYSGEFTPTITVAEAVTRRRVRLLVLSNVNIVDGTAIYIGSDGVQWAAVRTAAGWYTTGERITR
jgi:hypothetical protein